MYKSFVQCTAQHIQMSCTMSPMTRFSSRPGVYKAWSAWKIIFWHICILEPLCNKSEKFRYSIRAKRYFMNFTVNFPVRFCVQKQRGKTILTVECCDLQKFDVFFTQSWRATLEFRRRVCFKALLANHEILTRAKFWCTRVLKGVILFPNPYLSKDV